LLYVATHDTLTGLPNRYMFNQRFAHALNNAQRYRKTMALLFLDLDRFKFINDTLGHPFGDRLLQEAAARLRMCLRESDTIARFGGDEFVALIEDFSEPSDVISVAQKILHALRWPFMLQGETCHLTASIGISLYPNDGADFANLLKNADIATYRAKEQGKNNYLFYSGEMNDHLSARIAKETRLQGALERNEFILHYEPKVEINTGRITGMEALIRWQHPDLGLLPPVEFIGHAELQENTRRDQVDGHPPGDRRLRHRLFVPRVDQAVPVRLHQDRPLLHQGHSAGPGRRRDHASDHRDGAQPAAEGDRRRRGDPGAARLSRRARVP